MRTHTINRCSRCGQETVATDAACCRCGAALRQTNGRVPSGCVSELGIWCHRARPLHLVVALTTVALLMGGLAFLMAPARKPIHKPQFPPSNGVRAGKIPITPVFVTADRPQRYSPERFVEALGEKLAPDEVPLVVNPLASTLEMEGWARRLTRGVMGDLERASVLFVVLSNHVTGGAAEFAEPPTARDVFAAWDVPGSSFACQDLSFLYVALARAVGLDAYHVFVEEDCQGERVLHCCASVFIGRRVLLADPAYLTLGAPHRKFQILDDLQTSALFLAGKPELRYLRIAQKLAPGLSIVEVGLFEGLAREGRWNEAEAQLGAVVRADPEGPLSYAAEARIAQHAGEAEKAVGLLRKAIGAGPEIAQLHFALGSTFAQWGKWNEAREAYQNAWRYAPYRSAADTALGAIAFVDGAECQTIGAWDAALGHFDKAVTLRPLYPEAYLGRGWAREARNELQEAVADYNTAIRLNPALPQAYFCRGTAEYKLGDFQSALADYEKATQLAPRMAPAFGMLGWLHGNRREFKEALADFRLACELVPTDDYSRFGIWRMSCRLGKVAEANKELERYLDGRQRQKADDWPAQLGSFLVGRIGESGLLQMATGAGADSAVRLCEAWFYIATKRLIAGDAVGATGFLEKCTASGMSNLMEYASAAAELSYLKPGN